MGHENCLVHAKKKLQLKAILQFVKREPIIIFEFRLKFYPIKSTNESNFSESFNLLILVSENDLNHFKHNSKFNSSSMH